MFQTSSTVMVMVRLLPFLLNIVPKRSVRRVSPYIDYYVIALTYSYCCMPCIYNHKKRDHFKYPWYIAYSYLNLHVNS